MKEFNFKKLIRRNDYTIIFNRVGKRRLANHYGESLKMRISAYIWTLFNTIRWGHRPFGKSKRSKIQRLRRAHQGWRNMLLGRIQAIRVRRVYGRYKPTSSFRVKRYDK